MLSKLGYECDVAENGQEAVDAIENVKDYTLVFMDIQMPVMDGIEATIKILDKHGKNSPHIVAMTANVFQEDREKCFDCGMEDFVAKPIRKDELRRVIAKFGIAELRSMKKIS